MFKNCLNFIFYGFNIINLLLLFIGIIYIYILLTNLNTLVEIDKDFIGVLTFTYLGIIIIILSSIEYVLTFLFIKPYFFKVLPIIYANIITRTTKETRGSDKIEITPIVLFSIVRLSNLILCGVPF